MQEINLIEAVRQAMYEEMDRDQSVFILGEDIGVRGGVFLATDGFLEAFGANRVIDTPISESAIAGVALGAVGGHAKIARRVLEEEGLIHLLKDNKLA